jgi:hypothetical protein
LIYRTFHGNPMAKKATQPIRAIRLEYERIQTG